MINFKSSNNISTKKLNGDINEVPLISIWASLPDDSNRNLKNIENSTNRLSAKYEEISNNNSDNNKCKTHREGKYSFIIINFLKIMLKDLT